MMLYPAMRDLLKKIPSRYQMVNMVAHRAREISAEAEMAGEPLDDKPVSIAIRRASWTSRSSRSSRPRREVLSR